MIELKYTQEIKEKENLARFEVFTDQKGKKQFFLISRTRKNKKNRGVVVDFESGVLKKEILIEKWTGEIVNIECLRCIVSENAGKLFSIHYDESYRIKNDYHLKNDRCGDIYQTRIGFCVHDEGKIAFLSKKIEDEVVFYNLKDLKVESIWKAPKREDNKKTYLTWIRCCVEANSLIIIGCGHKTFLLSRKRNEGEKIMEMLYVVRENVFFDYGHKFIFGVCGASIFNGKNGLNLFRSEKEVDCVNVDESLVSFFCRYCYGGEIFFGDNERKDETNTFNSAGVIQFRSKNEIVKNFSDCDDSRFVVKNRGRDIYVVWSNKKTWNMSHFVNPKIPVLQAIDQDEIERIQYLFQMEDKKVNIVKISIFHTSEFNCLKIILLL